MRLTFFISLCLLLLVAGCTGSEGELKGPDEAPLLEQSESDSLPSLLPANLGEGAPAETTIAALLANPSAFENRLLQVEGLFQSSPGFNCADKRFGAPASWALADGQESIAAGGLESLAAALPDGQITLVVEGAWRSWPLPANCRQEGDPGELYYLDVVQVISPNPIALAPGDGSGAPVIQATTAADLLDSSQPTETDQSAVPTATALTGLEQPSQGTVNSGAFPPPVTTPSGESGAYPAPVPTSAPNPGAYPGPQNPTQTPVAQATEPAAEEPLDRDLLVSGSLETGSLGAVLSERWRYVSSAPQTIDLQIMPDVGLELTAAILGNSGQVIAANTTAAPGETVTLTAVNLPEAGEYAILLTTLEGSSGNYAILLTDEETYDFFFQQNMIDGFGHTGILLPESDHFYFFSGSAGDVIDITASPLDQADLFLRLFDPSSKALFTFHDENPPGQSESFNDYLLPDTGLYALLIGEQAFAGGPYEVVLERR